MSVFEYKSSNACVPRGQEWNSLYMCQNISSRTRGRGYISTSQTKTNKRCLYIYIYIYMYANLIYSVGRRILLTLIYLE
jgi:hypothetical protein